MVPSKKRDAPRHARLAPAVPCFRPNRGTHMAHGPKRLAEAVGYKRAQMIEDKTGSPMNSGQRMNPDGPPVSPPTRPVCKVRSRLAKHIYIIRKSSCRIALIIGIISRHSHGDRRSRDDRRARDDHTIDKLLVDLPRGKVIAEVDAYTPPATPTTRLVAPKVRTPQCSTITCSDWDVVMRDLFPREGLAAAARFLTRTLPRRHLPALLPRLTQADRDRLLPAFHRAAGATLQRAFLSSMHR
jgi:hypothetical protein